MTAAHPDRCVTVLCLNLRFGLAEDGPNNWEHRSQVYPALLRRHPADFYAFQEANDFQITFLHDLLKDYELIGRRTPAPDRWQNNVIFYHNSWQCRSSHHFYLSHTPDTPSKFEESRWPRQCTMGTFENDRDRLTVVNTHFDFKPEVQRQSALLIADRLKDRPPGHPVILMGDLNAGPDSSCIAALTDAAAGFRNAFQPKKSGTFHGFSGVAQGPPIDWILYRGDLTPEVSSVLTNPANSIFPSDHFPLMGVFRMGRS